MKNRVIKPNFESDLPDAVIFDIDGTLAIMGNRSPFNWRRVSIDDINTIVSEQIDFHRSKGRDIIIFTGRDEVCREDTVKWLEKHDIKFDKLYMKSIGDNRSDVITKTELYNKHIVDKYNLLCVYEDRIRICKMWYDLGVFVFNCNQGVIDF